MEIEGALKSDDVIYLVRDKTPRKRLVRGEYIIMLLFSPLISRQIY